MESRRVLVPVLLAFAAAGLYLMVLTSKEKALTEGYETAQVLVATVDIPERTVLKSDMFDAMSVPRKFVQQDAFEVRTRSDMNVISNLVTRVRVPKGNQLTESSLIAMTPEAGLSVKVPPGYRGAVLPIDPGLRSLIKPGDRVDVLLTFDAVLDGGVRDKATVTILQNVLVISVGNDLGQGVTAGQHKALAEKDDRAAALSDKALISLALNPNELQYLALMQRKGDTAIGVRGLGDYDMHPIPVVSIYGLLNDSRR
ncbi:MAG: Flp pilus assembly protein CpaB [Elusimicrobia bacterium]|nr:Flp pilus assembly protein CpaB [Elusimicrobiota bacterium]